MKNPLNEMLENPKMGVITPLAAMQLYGYSLSTSAMIENIGFSFSRLKYSRT